MIKTIISALTFIGLNVAPVHAMPNDHLRLIRTLESAQFKVHINHEVCDDERVKFGFYHQGNVFICQQNVPFGTRTVNPVWDNEDLDTLRHEIHHAVQDCQLNNMMDNELGHVYKYPLKFAHDVFGQEGINFVRKTYGHLEEKDQLLEIEAFAVATRNDVPDQISDIHRYCFIN